MNFASQKLLGRKLENAATPMNFTRSEKLACIGFRFPLQFNNTVLGARQEEEKQVQNHLRVCLSVELGFQNAVTVAPSEPLLAYAAHTIMELSPPSFDLPATLGAHLMTPGMSKGDRGELFGMVVMMRARDLVAKSSRSIDISLIGFMQALLPANFTLPARPRIFRTKAEQNIPFYKAFEHSRIYVTHFIKVDSYKVLTLEYICNLILRGAGVQCAEGQRLVDGALPVVLDARKPLQPTNVGICYRQDKNVARLNRVKHQILESIDPGDLGFFGAVDEVSGDDSDESLEESQESEEEAEGDVEVELGDDPMGSPEDGIIKPPIIRMVFSVGSSKCFVKMPMCPAPRFPRKNKGGPIRKSVYQGEFTAYDFWFSGATDKTFGCIKPSEVANYASILKSGKLTSVYDGGYKEKAPMAETLIRNMNPGTVNNPSHWTFAPDWSGMET